MNNNSNKAIVRGIIEIAHFIIIEFVVLLCALFMSGFYFCVCVCVRVSVCVCRKTNRRFQFVSRRLGKRNVRMEHS